MPARLVLSWKKSKMIQEPLVTKMVIPAPQRGLGERGNFQRWSCCCIPQYRAMSSGTYRDVEDEYAGIKSFQSQEESGQKILVQGRDQEVVLVVLGWLIFFSKIKVATIILILPPPLGSPSSITTSRNMDAPTTFVARETEGTQEAVAQRTNHGLRATYVRVLLPPFVATSKQVVVVVK
jgi:hypothetical protein